MSDRLEDFVKQHREQFDLREPDPSVWLKINPSAVPVEPVPMDPGHAVRERRPLRWLRIAAAVALIFAGSSAGIYYLARGGAEAELYSTELFREMQESELYYNQLVAERYMELQPYLASDPSVGRMLEADMEELDEVFEDLKKDLQDNVSNPEVIEAMIMNYRLKLEILEDMLYQLKEKENQDYEDERSYSL
jgi:hypothetical protein